MVEWMLALVAVLVTVSAFSTLSVWSGMNGNVGATFTSRTITVKLLVAIKWG